MRGGDLRRRVEDILRPGGRLIGEPGTSKAIRMLPGGIQAGEALFARLLEVAEKEENPHYPGTSVNIPGVGQVGFRPTSRSGHPTIDVKIVGIRIDEIKFEE